MNRTYFCKKAIILQSLCLLILFGCSSNTSVSIWDTSFNGSSYKTFFQVIFDTTIQGFSLTPDGNYAGGANGLFAFGEKQVWRVKPNAALDTSFGGTGIITLSNAIVKGIEDTLVTADGKMLVCGLSAVGDAMFVMRLNVDGSLDTSFNGTGYMTHSSAAGGNYDFAKTISVDGNGKIVVAGTSKDAGGDPDFAVWRINTDGTLDSTFNGTGFTSVDLGLGDESAVDIAIESSGRIVVLGSYVSGGTNYMAHFRLSANGILDNIYDTAFVSARLRGGTIALDSADNSYVTANFSILKFDPNGNLQLTFATSTSTASSVSNIVVMPDDRIFAIYSYSDPVSIARFTTEGVFKGSHRFPQIPNPYGGTADLGWNSLISDGAGKLVIAGTIYYDIDSNLTLWRLFEF